MAADKGDGRTIGAVDDAATAPAVEVGVGAVRLEFETEADENPTGAGAGVFAREKRGARWADARSQESKRHQATRGSYARHHCNGSTLLRPTIDWCARLCARPPSARRRCGGRLRAAPGATARGGRRSGAAHA